MQADALDQKLTPSGRATVADREVRCQPGDTLILPPAQVNQILAETESEFVSAMPIGGTVKLPDGMVIDLPWRKLVLLGPPYRRHPWCFARVLPQVLLEPLDRLSGLHFKQGCLVWRDGRCPEPPWRT